MEKTYFYRMGAYMYRHRWSVIISWLIIILCCIPFLPHIITPFQSTGFTATNSDSAKTENMLNDKLDYNYNRFVVLYKSKSLHATEWAFKKEVEASLEGIKKLKLKSEIFYPADNRQQISKNLHTAYAVILFKDNERMSIDTVTKIKKAIKKPKNMTMLIGGERVFIENINRQTRVDLNNADKIAAPVGTVVLILVFGSIVAALIPMCLGGGAAMIILTFLFLMAEMFNLSIFTLNIALLLGLCLVLDYSLFIIHRFRDELHNHRQICDAVAATMATAGKAIFYSGLSVFISLSAMLFFPVNIIFSLGVGGLVAVGAAVSMGITLLPALLSVIKKFVNAISIYQHKKSSDRRVHTISERFWLRLATRVVSHPFIFLIFSSIILAILSYPFYYAKYGISDYKILPEHTESRQFFDIYEDEFHVGELSPIKLVVSVDKGKVYYKSNLYKIYNLAKKLKKDKRIESVSSIVTTKPQLTRYQYYMMYKQSREKLPGSMQKLLKSTTTDKFTVITIVSKYDANAKETKALIKKLKSMKAPKGLSLGLTGLPVKNQDVMYAIEDYFPYVLVWIIGLTYLILLLLLRSVVLPLKAVVMTILSLMASYGILVFVFQEGHLAWLFNFNTQGILDFNLLIIIFCALFGFSMDYEVFLLSRIHEYFLKTKDNKKSVIFGIVKSSKVITSAALIVIVTCGSFMVADVVLVKAFGLGIAVAIFVDAFIIRTLLVPVIMILLGRWNWYIPKWLDKVLPGK